ncbi:hypothetical protein [Oceanisphaera arctica]|nr:hypothetical protein [Oceanisphaera arctica]GHA12327.1 hypothetical protein GCM10007082_11610 [Oceanisphaera arctica]
MQLIVGATPFSQWQHLKALLPLLGWNHNSSAKPEDWDSNEPVAGSPCLLLYLPVHIAVAYALDEGKTPTAALQQWQDALHQSLLFYRRHRRKTLLINVMQAVHNPQELLKYCQQRFGITAGPVSLQPMAPPSALHQLLAQQLIMQQREMADDLAELEAATTHLLEDTSTQEINIDQLYQQLIKQAQQSVQHSALLSRLDEEEQKNHEVVTLLHSMQGELKVLQQQNTGYENALHQHKHQAESLGEELQRLQVTKNVLKQKSDSAQAELHHIQQNKQDVEEENELILQQLHLVQEELERYYRDNQQLAQQLAHQQQQLAENSQQLQKLTTSFSWKVTIPIRALGKTFRKTTPEQRSLKQQITLLKKSTLFDTEWYLSTYPDVAESGMLAIKHYLKVGAFEGRNPSEHFDTNWYLKLYSDVVEAELNPLVHYLKYGQKEGREPKATS